MWLFSFLSNQSFLLPQARLLAKLVHIYTLYSWNVNFYEVWNWLVFYSNWQPDYPATEVKVYSWQQMGCYNLFQKKYLQYIWALIRFPKKNGSRSQLQTVSEIKIKRLVYLCFSKVHFCTFYVLMCIIYVLICAFKEIDHLNIYIYS